MDGKGYSEFYRNTSEELFIKAMMESSIGMPAPTMETLGFKNLTQSFRTDSEELFKSWLTNGENNGSHSAGTGHRPRQASRRISTELASLTNQNGGAVQRRSNDDVLQNGGAVQRRSNDDVLFSQPASLAVDSPDDLNSTRAPVDKGLQSSNLFLAKAWFHSSQPMTRSRSSELRRRYAAMQNSLTQIGTEATQLVSGNGVNNFNQEPADANLLDTISTCENPNLFGPLISPSNSSSTMFHNPQVGSSSDKISSVVSMLKCTLERKKLSNQVENEAIVDSSLVYYNSEDVLVDASLHQGQEIHGHQNQGTVQDAYTLGARDAEVLKTIEESLLEDIMSPLNPADISTISREPSQSESSAAPQIASNGFDMSGVCESSRIQMGIERSPENCSRTQDFRERAYDNSKDDQKKRGLIRYGSITSAGSVDGGDPTKKRRVERSRKMAEAKERSSTPPVPSQMQSILKRCENLEKEVRSLKLNLAFMNRKDSEQTKQIEELEKQNQELAEEKERLLEEIERIIADTGKM